MPNGLFTNGSGELKKLAAAAPIFGDIISYVKANAAAATGAVSVTNLLYALTHPWMWGSIAAPLFIVSTVFVMKAGPYLPKSFPPGTEVIIATAFATLLSMSFDYPGGIVGEIPQLDPDAGIKLGPIKIPIEIMNPKDLLAAPVVERFGGSYITLIITAALFAAVNFLSIMGIASGFEAENGVAWSAPRELVAQGVACGVAGLTVSCQSVFVSSSYIL